MTIVIEKAALLMSVQDWGRHGFLRFGMPESGPMDWWAFWGANCLAGNAQDAACIEIGFSSAMIGFEIQTLAAVCGTGFRLHLNDQPMPLWVSFWINRGDQLRIEKTDGGNWAYLAVAGGIHTPIWMGSRSVNPRAGLGRLIQAGDRLAISPQTSQARFSAGRLLSTSQRPCYHPNPEIGVIPGPHTQRFTRLGLEAFWGGRFRVSSQSDRMGFRLTGPDLPHKETADLVSQGMALGEVQVPGDGEPIVMMPDHPTTGGYTSIGTVARVDLPLLAQAVPGAADIGFQPISVSAAQGMLAEAFQKITNLESPQEDVWMNL